MIFSSSGRVGPIRFALVAVAMGCACRAGVWALEWGEMITYVFAGAALGALLAWFAAEAARRLHDTGWRGAWGLAVAVVLVAPPIAITPTTLAYDPRWLMPALQILALLVAAVLLLRPGARGANRFGEAPAGVLAYAPGPGGSRAGRGALWVGISVLGCASLALAIINLSNGMRMAHERDLRFEQAEKPR